MADTLVRIQPTNLRRREVPARELAERINAYWGRSVAFVKRASIQWTDENGRRHAIVTEIVRSTLDHRGMPPGATRLPA